MVEVIINFLRRYREAGIAIVSLGFLLFIAGAAFDFFKIFPYKAIQNSFLAAEALREHYLTSQETLERTIWHPSRYGGKGVTKKDELAAFPGLTLYASADAQRAYLIDLDGNIVHQWVRTFRDVWPEPAHVAHVVAPALISYRRVIAQPNGDLLVIVDGVGTTPYGFGLFKIDKDSNLLWKYSEPAHHDIDVAPDGTIYTLIHYNEFSLPDEGKISNIETPFIDDYVVKLSPDGEELDRVNVVQAILDSKYDYLLRRKTEPPDDKRDPVHNNTVKVLSEALALAHPYAKAGQVLLSMKGLNLIALLDIELRKVVWAARGPWRAQHDPRFLENGNILLFDNRGNFGPGRRSQILEIDPKTLNIAWSYKGTKDDIFESDVRGMSQRLPNGNTLITESRLGRLFEITREGKIVWEFIVPARRGDLELIPVVSSGLRYSRNDLPFLDNL